jgi:hypothetical protein
MARQSGLAAGVEIVGPQVVVRVAVIEEVPDDDKNGVPDGEGCFLAAAACGEPTRRAPFHSPVATGSAMIAERHMKARAGQRT